MGIQFLSKYLQISQTNHLFDFQSFVEPKKLVRQQMYNINVEKRGNFATF